MCVCVCVCVCVCLCLCVYIYACVWEGNKRERRVTEGWGRCLLKSANLKVRTGPGMKQSSFT